MQRDEQVAKALHDFQESTSRTWTNPCPDYLAIAGMGLAGEAAEVASALAVIIGGGPSPCRVEQLRLELGDALHYAAAMARSLGCELGRIYLGPKLDRRCNSSLMELGFSLMVFAGRACDTAKKQRFHGHPVGMTPELEDYLRALLGDCEAIARRFRLTLEDVLAGNVAKQLARYPNGFSPEASIARADIQC